VTADSLDVVSETCETVERTVVEPAGDTPEDAPPTVAFTTSTGPTLAATAADDRGVAAVQFLDDERIVCTDDTAPYACDFRARGEDVGRNTLTVVAIDTAQQTATDRRALTVPRFAPAKVTLRVARRRASGTVALPAEVAPALGCTGFVTLETRRGAKRTASKRLRLKPDCTFAGRVTLRPRTRVRASFAGNDVLSAKASPFRPAPRVSPR
jgi:hypothetical protein